jgi:hypothetical protein
MGSCSRLGSRSARSSNNGPCRHCSRSIPWGRTSSRRSRNYRSTGRRSLPGRKGSRCRFGNACRGRSKCPCSTRVRRDSTLRRSNFQGDPVPQRSRSLRHLQERHMPGRLLPSRSRGSTSLRCTPLPACSPICGISWRRQDTYQEATPSRCHTWGAGKRRRIRAPEPDCSGIWRRIERLPG